MLNYVGISVKSRAKAVRRVADLYKLTAGQNFRMNTPVVAVPGRVPSNPWMYIFGGELYSLVHKKDRAGKLASGTLEGVYLAIEHGIHRIN